MELFPDFLRAVISTTANVFLMMTLLQPKYSKKITRLVMLGILAADLGTAIYCYISGNLTLLSKIDTVLFLILCFVVRPIFKDNLMQWLFSYLTVQNISDIVIILSYDGSRFLPYPMYANSVLRLILFSCFFYVLFRYVRPLYRQAVEHWTTFFAVALALYLTFSYYVISADDVVVMLTEEMVPLLLVILIGLASYGSILFSLYNLKREYTIREVNQRLQADKEYLNLSAKAMNEQLKLMDEALQQKRIAAHDHRHFNHTVLELLEQGKVEGAEDLLRGSVKEPPASLKKYCINPTVNAAVCWYVRLAEDAGIACDIMLDIPLKLQVDELELSMVVANLMENAIHGCEALDDNIPKYIHFNCRNAGRLLLEIENPCVSSVMLDENGMPETSQEGHGTGSRSITAFVEKYNGEVLYRVEAGVFSLRLIV